MFEIGPDRPECCLLCGQPLARVECVLCGAPLPEPANDDHDHPDDGAPTPPAA